MVGRLDHAMIDDGTYLDTKMIFSHGLTSYFVVI
jgi:hypothetical protein